MLCTYCMEPIHYFATPFSTYLVSYYVEPIAVYTYSFASRRKYIETHFRILQRLTVRTYLLYWAPVNCRIFAAAHGTHIFTVLNSPCPHCRIFATGHSTRIIYCIEPISVCICICNSFSSSSPPLLTVGLRQEGGFSGPGLLRERGEEGGRAGWEGDDGDAYDAMGYRESRCIRRDGISPRACVSW